MFDCIHHIKLLNGDWFAVYVTGSDDWRIEFYTGLPVVIDNNDEHRW